MKRIAVISIVALKLLTTAPLALAALPTTEVPAHYCELFIDKVLAQTNPTNGVQELHVYLKTLNDRLQGKLQKVSFWHEVIGRETDWEETVIPSFAGVAQDYWELVLPIEANGTPQNYLGRFYVVTDQDVRYWLNSSRVDQDFTFDDSLLTAVQQAMGIPVSPANPGGNAANDRMAVNTRDSSVDVIRALNPDHCP